ncbi:hypothetical protein MMC09_003024 [Bachmanniomyces sp. S44760]|nr:hypothetical protein [Bachmanniomyces sp. S44760]
MTEGHWLHRKVLKVIGENDDGFDNVATSSTESNRGHGLTPSNSTFGSNTSALTGCGRSPKPRMWDAATSMPPCIIGYVSRNTINYIPIEIDAGESVTSQVNPENGHTTLGLEKCHGKLDLPPWVIVYNIGDELPHGIRLKKPKQFSVFYLMNTNEGRLDWYVCWKQRGSSKQKSRPGRPINEAVALVQMWCLLEVSQADNAYHLHHVDGSIQEIRITQGDVRRGIPRVYIRKPKATYTECLPDATLPDPASEADLLASSSNHGLDRGLNIIDDLLIPAQSHQKRSESDHWPGVSITVKKPEPGVESSVPSQRRARNVWRNSITRESLLRPQGYLTEPPRFTDKEYMAYESLPLNYQHNDNDNQQDLNLEAIPENSLP